MSYLSYKCRARASLIGDELLSIYTPTYAYEFSDASAPMLFLPPVSFPYNVTHTDELQFLFTNLGGGHSLLGGNENTLATTMKSYWTQFAKNGNPNGLRTPGWPAFSILAPSVQSLVAPNPKLRLNFSQEHYCDFWEGILV